MLRQNLAEWALLAIHLCLRFQLMQKLKVCDPCSLSRARLRSILPCKQAKHAALPLMSDVTKLVTLLMTAVLSLKQAEKHWFLVHRAGAGLMRPHLTW